DKEGVLDATLRFGDKPISGARLTVSGLKGEERQADTDEAGRATFPLSPSDLPREGPNLLTVHFSGDARHNGVEVVRPVTLAVPVAIELSGPKEVATDEEFSLSGRLTTPLGPLALKSVSLVGRVSKGEDRPLTTAITDAEGRFGLTLEAQIFKSG